MKKAFTTVELIVSFSLTMVIVVFLFQLVVSLKNIYIANLLKTELLNMQAIISDKINTSFSKKTIKNITKCGSYCLNFIYSDNSKEMLKIDYNENSIEFGSYKDVLPDNSYISNPSIDLAYSGTFSKKSNNALLIINIPIYNDFLKNQNYGINVIYQYNSENYNLSLPGFNDYNGEYGYLKLNGESNLVISRFNEYNDSGYTVVDSQGEEISDATVKVTNPFIDMDIPYNLGIYKIEYALFHDDKQVEVLYRYVAVEDATFEYDYTGGEQMFTVPHSGYYKLEAWGAQGGGANGGKGAYTSGMIYLNEGEKIYVYVGSQGGSNNTVTNIGGYNGGGYSGDYSGSNSYGGGGATDFRLNNGTWNDSTSLASRIMVAAGGAGGVNILTTIGGEGGTLIGGNSTTSNSSFTSSIYSTTGGTQIGAGLSYQSARGGSFGQGKQSNTYGWGGGGGSGYYGGSTGHGRTGAGGSSYVSGYSGCIAIKSATDITPKVTTYSKIEDSYHYSGKIFENATMIDGNTSMPTHDGQGTMTGNSGNGYAKITYVGE